MFVAHFVLIMKFIFDINYHNYNTKLEYRLKYSKKTIKRYPLDFPFYVEKSVDIFDKRQFESFKLHHEKILVIIQFSGDNINYSVTFIISDTA